MEDSKEWLVADDRKLARGAILEEARRKLTHLQDNLSPDYSSTTVNRTYSKPDTTDIRTWILRDSA